MELILLSSMLARSPIELDATECAEVVGVELGGGTNLSSGRDRRMRGRDGRRESRRLVGGVCRGGERIKMPKRGGELGFSKN
jgi:hypothetical protein